MLEKKNKGKLICKSPNDIISGNFDSEKVRGVYSSIIPPPWGGGKESKGLRARDNLVPRACPFAG
jgi:hypothetical protein